MQIYLKIKKIKNVTLETRRTSNTHHHAKHTLTPNLHLRTTFRRTKPSPRQWSKRVLTNPKIKKFHANLLKHVFIDLNQLTDPLNDV